MKKKLIKLGSIAMLAPIAAVVSCGINSPSKEQIANRNKLESQQTMDKIEERWQLKVLDKAGEVIDFDTAHSTSILRKAFNFYIENQIEKNPLFLNGVAQRILSTDEFKAVSKGNTQKVLNDWKLLDYRSATNNPSITEDAKKFLFKNVSDIRTEVLKLAVSYTFLTSTITPVDYQDIVMGEFTKLSEVQQKINDTEFPLVNEAIKQHLFGKWTLSSDSSNLQTLTGSSELDFDDAKTAMKANGKLAKEVKYSSQKEKAFSGGLFDTADLAMLGYKGITSVSGSKGIITFSSDELDSATSPTSWNGFLVDGEIKSSGKIELFPNGSKTASLTRIIGLMPIMANKKLTFAGTTFTAGTTKKERLVFELAKSRSVYTDSVKYYTNKKSPIKITILNDFVKDAAIDHGFEFIEE